MKPLTDEFKTACNNTTKQFDAIIDALQLSRNIRPSEVRRILSFIDNVIDYYVKLEKVQNIRYPIVYIPCAKDWAEEVCIEYVLYKIEASFDADRMYDIKTSLQKPIDATNRGLDEAGQQRFCKEERNWRKKIKPIVSVADTNTNTKNLIVCGQSVYNKISSKQVLMRFLEGSTKTSITRTGVIDVEEKYAFYKDIENVFCFYSNNRICDDYELNNLINWDGLRNCFIFEFNTAPYCLDNVLKWGKRLCDKFTHQYLLSKDETRSIYQDFITLTREEAHYLFNEEATQVHTMIPYPTAIENEIEYIADFYRGDDGWRFSIKDRNILSLCLCEEAQIAYMNYLKNEKSVLFDDSFGKATLESILEHFPKNEIVDEIFSYIQPDAKAAFVICDVPKSVKTSLINFFKNKNIAIKFYKYKDLKDKGVKEKKIVVLRFCPHNLSSKNYPHKNPNSFDEYSISEGQSILDIINELTILDYSKFKYDYDLYLCLATSSRFRRDLLGGDLKTPKKPDIQYISLYSEFDDDANETSQNTIPTVKFEFSDGQSSSLPENEMLICENRDGERFIESFRNLNEFGQINKLYAIQPLYELADKTIDVFFDDARNTTSGIENKWRDELVDQGFIPKEHCREVPIWKFLLERKVRNYCIENQLIDSNQQEPLWQLLRQNINNEHLQSLHNMLGVRVQIERVLRDWCDITKVEPIIPGFKKDRENLMINYLGLNRGEILLYRKKQLLTRDMTRTRNSVTEGFLSKILFDDITDELVAELLDDPQYSEYLAIDTKEDIETLKSIAEENIILKPIKSYSL